MNRWSFERRDSSSFVLKAPNVQRELPNGRAVRLRTIVSDYKGADVVIRFSESGTLLEIVAEERDASSRTIGEFVADAVGNAPYRARPALCRLLLADSRLNLTMAASKTPLKALGSSTASSQSTAFGTETWITAIERVEAIQKECESVLERHRKAEKRRGAFEEWKRIDDEFVSGLERCATEYEALEAYVCSQPRGVD